MLEFQGDVQLAYDKLVDDFGDLAALIQSYEEKLFLKVLQKIISGMADKLCELLEALERFEVRRDEEVLKDMKDPYDSESSEF